MDSSSSNAIPVSELAQNKDAIVNENETTSSQPKKIEPKYIGLPNQGATCYMNSLLQTLFMTPEFRQTLYEWKYNENEHAKPEDCIPFQLQKLFASLQMKYSGSTSTKPLTKSFQWTDSTSFEQHDIQEFSSVLFDAIEESLKSTNKENIINDFYEGTTVNYVKCLECGNESSRPENFLNIGLTVKNEFDKIYNDSLQKALQIFLKPEKLEGSNQYFCEICNKKVDATKGTKFVKLPKLMNVIINRFSFDFIYLKRIKLDDFFSFPFILNMNDYINGYEGIKNKVSEESTPEYFADAMHQKKSTDTKKNSTKNTSGTTTVGGKPVRSQAKSFISELKKKGEQKKNNIDVVIYTKDFNDINAYPLIPETNSSNQKNEIISTEKITQEQNSEKTLKQSSQNLDNEAKSGNQDLRSKPFGGSGDYYDIREESGATPSKKVKKVESKLKQSELDMIEEENKDDPEEKKAKEEKENKRKAERNNLIKEYLNEGPLVYELYSILIHSGGAYGGHYYAYIKSFEDWKWYNFNDTSVNEINPDEIPSKAFGGAKSANAYMLMYRQIEGEEEMSFNLGPEVIPEYLKKFIEEENKKLVDFEMQQIEKAKNMNFRVYDKLEVKYIHGHQDETFGQFQEKILKAYDIKEKPENVRVRVYHPLTDSKQDTFTNRLDKTLAELKINTTKSFCIEIKRDDEVFEEYDADSTYFKVALWRENIQSLAEDSLHPEKIFVNKEGTIKDLVDGISKKFNISLNKILLIKKSQMAGIPYADILNREENLDKKFAEVRVYEGSVLYVEKYEDPNAPLLWKEEFDKDTYNFKIKFNTPYTENNEIITDFGNFVMIDSRKSLVDFKAEICKILNLNENEIILRKGGRMGIEIKDLRQTIQSAGFVTGSSIYIEFGKPTMIGQMRIYVSLAIKKEEEDDVSSHDFIDLFELIISGENTATEVKELIVQEAKKSQVYDWDPKLLRLREKVANRLVRVYRNTALKTQGVADKKQVAIEVLDEPEVLTPKENLIVVRLWNPSTLDISPRMEIIIDRNKSLKQLAEKIHEKNSNINVENIMGCKVLGAWKFIKYDLLFQEWTDFNDENSLLYSHPLYVNVDGTLVFIKDKTIQAKELTEEEKKNIGIGRVHHKSSHTSGSTYSSHTVEKSLKIHVKKKEVTSQNELPEEKDNLKTTDSPGMTINYGDYEFDDSDNRAKDGSFEPFF